MKGITFNKTDKIILISILTVIVAIIGILNSFAEVKEEIVYEKYIVKQGDTLWNLAYTINPDANPRSIIEQIKEKNKMESSMIYVGQIILIPSYIKRIDSSIEKLSPSPNQ